MPTSAEPSSRHQGLAAGDARAWRTFLRRWGISLASLASGLLTLFVFRRGVPRVAWLVGYVVVLWLLVAALAPVRARLLAAGRRRVVSAGEYTIQTLYHGLLLFVLPGYFASTTLDGPTAPFFLVLTLAALVTTVDPWYQAIVSPRPWLGRAFFAFALFAGLNVALPLVGVPPEGALLGSAGLAGLAVTPAYARPAGSWGTAVGLAVGSTASAVGLAWLVLPAIPPVPLQLVAPTMARDVIDRTPVDPVSGASQAVLAEGAGLVAYTPVAAPAGLRQPILHRWSHDGRPVTIVRLPTAIEGGRLGGFRTFSRKTDFGPDAAGRWTVDVLTASGQLIGRLRFTVEP